MNTNSSKSNQFANDQIIHHIAVSSAQSQSSIGYQNYHLNHGLTTTQLNGNLLTNLSLNTTKSNSNQFSNQIQTKHIRTKNEGSKSFDLTVRCSEINLISRLVLRLFLSLCLRLFLRLFLRFLIKLIRTF